MIQGRVCLIRMVRPGRLEALPPCSFATVEFLSTDSRELAHLSGWEGTPPLDRNTIAFCSSSRDHRVLALLEAVPLEIIASVGEDDKSRVVP